MGPRQQAEGAAQPDKEWVVWSDREQRATVLTGDLGVAVSLGRGESDILTVVPLLRHDAFQFAPVGKANTSYWPFEAQLMFAQHCRRYLCGFERR